LFPLSENDNRFRSAKVSHAICQLSYLSSAVARFCCICCCREEVGVWDGRRLVLSWRCRHEGDALRQVVRLCVNRAWRELAATEVIVDVV